jgi:hypothetical protein
MIRSRQPAAKWRFSPAVGARLPSEIGRFRRRQKGFAGNGFRDNLDVPRTRPVALGRNRRRDAHLRQIGRVLSGRRTID